MSLDLDDLQEFRHKARGIAKNAAVMLDALRGEPSITDELAADLVRDWWRITMSAATAPDFGALVRGMLPSDDSDDS